jgi:adenine-specific DNA-methyltransferase
VKPAEQMSAAKLRGGFYTPGPLVDLCLRLIAELVPRGSLKVLEPSAGDGAFVRRLARSDLRSRIASITAIEPLEIEAEKVRRAYNGAGFRGEVSSQSAVSWATRTDELYDAAVGNPPFVRYQFVSAADRAATIDLGRRMDVAFAGVGNLWIGVLLGALSRLRGGGAFAFVVPSECLTGVSASVVRAWLIRECAAVRLDIFPPGSFPDVLQEILVLSGRREGSASVPLRLRLVEQLPSGVELDWLHDVRDSGAWTKYLLAPGHVRALDAAASDARVSRVSELVAFEVSIVTGANDFFTIAAGELAAYDLGDWVRPLLPRIRHATGLRYAAADHAETEASGARAWLLDFSAARRDPCTVTGPLMYLEQGERRDLDTRYKCRIREPWYRVPGIKAGELLLSKRSHHHPRVVVNEAGVFTTDTIYRGRMLTDAITPGAVAANFHNSLTLLSAELEGRSFGGGVLELVPSEVGRLLAHADEPPAALLNELDAIARSSPDPDALVAATDASLVRRGLIDEDVLAELARARALLVARRLDRNRRAPAASREDAGERRAAAG